MKLQFKLNGTDVSIDATGGERVIDLLREKLELVGTKEGCGKGECGACTVLLDGEPVCSCLLLSAQIIGREIITIEGVEMGPVKEAFESTGAVQCGFCSPGMVLSATALLMKKKTPSKNEIKRALSGNLCRCTGYEKIIDAVELASTNIKAIK
jgi:aerobic-type carbon monoxide dehydrogenase small subunit (CoxS/CutS family)